MKIYREINGVPVAIELSNEEREEAYEEQRLVWDCEYVRARVRDHDTDRFDGLNGEELEDAIQFVAELMREYIYDASDDDAAFWKACDKYFADNAGNVAIDEDDECDYCCNECSINGSCERQEHMSDEEEE